MKPSARLFAVALASLLLAVPVAAHAGGPHGHRGGGHGMAPPGLLIDDHRGRFGMRRPDQDAAYAATREGAVLPLRQIEGRVVPRMPGASYLGPEFDSGSGTYRLKFMSRGAVSWIDVDGRTGAIIGRSGE